MPKWYAEGNAVYYQTLLPWRAGLMPIEKRLADINLTAARYYTNDVIDAPDSDILPKFWSDMRYNVLPYDRGAIYFAALDGKIRRASGGKRSVDDPIRAMVALDRDEQTVSEKTWIDLLRKELGEQGPAIHQAMMTGQKLVPESGDYGPCFRRISVKIPRYDLGFGGPEITRRSVVENLRADSNAAKAGLKEGDRVQYQSSTDGAQRDPNMPLTMQVTRDGKTFEVTYLPRGELRDAYQWERIAGVPEDACRGTSGPQPKPAK
jgi:predicted metalloprotease with PDZ domain